MAGPKGRRRSGLGTACGKIDRGGEENTRILEEEFGDNFETCAGEFVQEPRHEEDVQNGDDENLSCNDQPPEAW